MDLCTVTGCTNSILVKAHGLCNMHYKRQSRLGSVGEATPRKAHAGSGAITKGGYRQVRVNGAVKYEHIYIAELALGKPLPIGAQVHHVDTNRLNNAPDNLVICPNEGYHKLLHRRMDAYEATGNPDALKCPYCKQYDDPKNLTGKAHYHAECVNDYKRNKRQLKKEKQDVIN